MFDSHSEPVSVNDHVVFDDGDATNPWLKHGRVTAIDEQSITITSAEHGEISYRKEELLTGPEGFIMTVPAALAA